MECRPFSPILCFQSDVKVDYCGKKGQIEDLYSELESGKLDCKIKPI